MQKCNLENYNNYITEFFYNRDDLIERLMNDEIDKNDFLKMNYDFLKSCNAKPFLIIDTFEKGMHNYQYYNVMAKFYCKKLSESRGQNKKQSYYKKYQDDIKSYYDEKDKITFRLLRYIKFENVEAYYINTDSKQLEGELFEIVIKNEKYAVLHSKAEWIKNSLIREGVFDNNIKKSVIDHYVNQKY